ncbi:MAG: thioredoxin [Chloroflexota bacterium]|nr:thioredoxin [Chloroflexota bacterium]
MGKPVEIQDSNFDQMVSKSEIPVVVDFGAPWCGPCRMVEPILDELAEEYSGKISIMRLDVDQNPKTASKYGIMSIPYLLIFRNGEPVSNIVGFRPKAELKRSLDAVLE